MNEQFVSIVVATKDRPVELARLLASLSAQTRKPDQVVVVDSSTDPVEQVAASFGAALNLLYRHHWPPSASAQRNRGVRCCEPHSTLIGFVDDDTTFEPDAFANMLDFWKSAGSDSLAGAAFNILNYEMPSGQWLKRSQFVSKLGLYSAAPGGVARSGWQSVFGRLPRTTYVEWLPSSAVVWRSDLLKDASFDEYFSGYSYLEDLDFSFSAGKRGRLGVVASAGYSHFPSANGRVSSRQFGQVEVRNRLHFVRKHSLSLLRCHICIFIRLTMTVMQAVANPGRGYLARAQGNLDAILSS